MNKMNTTTALNAGHCALTVMAVRQKVESGDYNNRKLMNMLTEAIWCVPDEYGELQDVLIETIDLLFDSFPNEVILSNLDEIQRLLVESFYSPVIPEKYDIINSF